MAVWPAAAVGILVEPDPGLPDPGLGPGLGPGTGPEPPGVGLTPPGLPDPELGAGAGPEPPGVGLTPPGPPTGTVVLVAMTWVVTYGVAGQLCTDGGQDVTVYTVVE